MPDNVIALSRTTSGLASAMRISLMRLSRRLRYDIHEEHSSNQLAVLFTLARLGPATIGTLAGAEKVQPPSMTRTVTCLTEKGLVRRAASETDGRVAVISLTPAGEQVLTESRRRKEMWLQQRLRELTPEQRQTLRDAAPILEMLSRA